MTTYSTYFIKTNRTLYHSSYMYKFDIVIRSIIGKIKSKFFEDINSNNKSQNTKSKDESRIDIVSLVNPKPHTEKQEEI